MASLLLVDFLPNWNKNLKLLDNLVFPGKPFFSLPVPCCIHTSVGVSFLPELGLQSAGIKKNTHPKYYFIFLNIEILLLTKYISREDKNH